MKYLIHAMICTLFGTGLAAQQAADLSEFLWQKRPIVIFADTDQDPRFIQQLAMLQSDLDALEDRDVVILTDTDPQAMGPLREALRPRGFTFVLIGKDGTVKLRKPHPWTPRELAHLIDKMPMRQQEMNRR